MKFTGPFALIFLLYFLFTGSSHAQVTYTQAVRYSYDSVFNNLDPRLQRMATDTSSRMRGVVLLTSFEIDTLNKSDFIPQVASGSLGADTLRVKGYVPEKLLIPDLLIGNARLKKDSLLIQISPWFRNGEIIKHKVSGESLHSTYSLWSRDDKTFTAKVYKEENGNLVVGTISKLVLNDRSFGMGKSIYGSAELESQDFFQLPDKAFKDNMINIRLRYNYVFKMVVLKDDGY